MSQDLNEQVRVWVFLFYLITELEYVFWGGKLSHFQTNHIGGGIHTNKSCNKYNDFVKKRTLFYCISYRIEIILCPGEFYQINLYSK